MKKRAVPLHHYFLLDSNRVIRFLTLSDIVWGGAAGLLGPIFALFIVDFIEGGSALVAGTAATVFLVSKSLMQIPAATIMDRIRGERDDFWFMLCSSAITASLPLTYLLIDSPGQLYMVQFFMGLSTAVTFPSWMAIFTRHIDANKEGTEWGVYYTVTDMSAAIAAGLGGALATTIGFEALIWIVVSVSLLGVLFLIPLRGNMRGPAKQRRR